jgi:hypothetical protein
MAATMTIPPVKFIEYEKARTFVRVSFGQRSGPYVTASLRHSIGPLIADDMVIAFEIDDDELLYAPAQVVEFDPTKGVALLAVENSEIKIASSFEIERPLEHFKQSEDELSRDPMALPV